MGDLIQADRDVLLQVYATIEGRRQGFASMMWEVPGLAIASQAFLLTGAISPDGDRNFRFGAAVLAVLVAGATIQLMTKHRNAEIVDSKLLEDMERTLGITLGHPNHPGVVPHSKPSDRFAALGQKLNLLDHVPSFEVWRWLLAAFLVLGVALAAAITVGAV